jgi:hypothetical protein
MKAIVRDTGQTFHGLRKLHLEYAGFVVASSVIWVPEAITASMLEDHLNGVIEEEERKVWMAEPTM